MSKKITAEIELLHKDVNQLLQLGKTRPEIIELLKKDGIEDYYANRIIACNT